MAESAGELATLPLKRGFRQRGTEMTRLETFTWPAVSDSTDGCVSSPLQTRQAFQAGHLSQSCLGSRCQSLTA